MALWLAEVDKGGWAWDATSWDVFGMLSSAMAGWLTQRFCARRVVAAGDDQSGQPATEFALLARLAYAAKAATVSPYDTAVLKLNLNRIRHVGVLCGNTIFQASVLRWNTGAPDVANVSKRSRY